MKLIVVSNRGPVTYARDAQDERVARRGGGGLVTALRSLVTHHDVTWVASAMSSEDRVVAEESGGAFDELARDGSSYRLRFVAHNPQAYDWYYNVISNPTLWFLHHYLWDLVEHPNLDHGLHHAWENGYVVVNRAFADAVVEELDRQPDAAVFFHDYHLYLAPRFVRTERADARLAHFIHIPWPEADYWHVLPLPIRRSIHDGLLANDSIGFHTRRWRRNFMRSAEDIVGSSCDWARDLVGYEGKRVAVTAAPISVDPSEFDELAQSRAVLAAGRDLARGRPEKVILRVDRTDPSKNIVRGFRALELYLEAHPEMHRRVILRALLDPSRQNIPEYAEYIGAIQREARRVNVRFDGLNLIAQEAPLVNERDGVLILSENTGSHEELGDWALTVNPFDVAGQADALHRALTMPEDERRERLEAIQAWVRDHDLAAWTAVQLAALEREETPVRS
jgi:trehalose 6-phosphate synthase